MRLLLSWILSAIAVWIVAHLVPGISVSGPVAALIAAAEELPVGPAELAVLALAAASHGWDGALVLALVLVVGVAVVVDLVAHRLISRL